MEIDREHPDYKRRKAMWKVYRDLHLGGEQLKENAAEYLVRRQKEPGDVFAERLGRVRGAMPAGRRAGFLSWFRQRYRTERTRTR